MTSLTSSLEKRRLSPGGLAVYMYQRRGVRTFGVHDSQGLTIFPRVLDIFLPLLSRCAQADQFL